MFEMLYAGTIVVKNDFDEVISREIFVSDVLDKVKNAVNDSIYKLDDIVSIEITYEKLKAVGNIKTLPKKCGLEIVGINGRIIKIHESATSKAFKDYMNTHAEFDANTKYVGSKVKMTYGIAKFI